MTKPKIISSVQFLFRIILGGLLVFAGILKIQDSTTLFESVAYITWLPIGLKSLIIDFLPWAEIVIGGLLLLHVFDKVMIPLTGLIYASFLIFAIWGLSSGIEIDCGCFGDLDESSFLGALLGSEISIQMVIRNSIFVLMTGFLFWQPESDTNEE
jgi:uncharacterized membrane protein YphA (DoxX/SURF4 family)